MGVTKIPYFEEHIFLIEWSLSGWWNSRNVIEGNSITRGRSHIELLHGFSRSPQTHPPPSQLCRIFKLTLFKIKKPRWSAYSLICCLICCTIFLRWAFGWASGLKILQKLRINWISATNNNFLHFLSTQLPSSLIAFSIAVRLVSCNSLCWLTLLATL